MEAANAQSRGSVHASSAMASSPLSQEHQSVENVVAVGNDGYPSTSSAFSSSAHPDEDWTKVSDLAERRRIQNRIAQRNYRKKIKERMADLERRAGSDGNKSGSTGSKKTRRRQLSPPLPGHQMLQPPSLSGVPQHPFTPPMNPEDHFFPSPSPPATQDKKTPPFETSRSGMQSLAYSTETSQPVTSQASATSYRAFSPHHDDDDLSLRSFTESLFDVTSGVSSASSYTNNHAMVASLLDILVEDPDVDHLLSLTTSEFRSSPGRFTRNFSKILKTYSRHLCQAIERSITTKDDREKYINASRSVCSIRHRVSNLIASRYNERDPAAQDLKHSHDIISRHLDNPVPTENDDASSNDESSEDESEIAVPDNIKTFLVSGEPFCLLKRNLRSLIIPDEFLDCIYESSLAFVDLALADRTMLSFTQALRRRALDNRQEVQDDLKMQIGLMATELREECTDSSQLDASIFLSTYSEYISTVAIDRVVDSPGGRDQDAPNAMALPGRRLVRPAQPSESDSSSQDESTIQAREAKVSPNSTMAYDAAVPLRTQKKVAFQEDISPTPDIPQVQISSPPSPGPKTRTHRPRVHPSQVHSLSKDATHVSMIFQKEDDTSAQLPHKNLLEHVLYGMLPSVLYVDLVPHWKFIASSAAFSSFGYALRDLAGKTFFSEARRVLRASIQSAETGEEELLALERQRLLPILSEMESCLSENNAAVSFSMDSPKSQITLADRLKLAIEASTADEWNWWPLQPPLRSESHSRVELSWQCSCGVRRRESILPRYAATLESISNRLPLRLSGSQGHVDRPTSSLSDSSSQGARSTQSTDSSSMNRDDGQSLRSVPSLTGSTATSHGEDSVVDFSHGPRRYIYVFILVKTSEYVLDTIDVSSMKAREFFQKLRTTYKEQRGLWRRVFSIFVYNHCDFVKIIKPEPETFLPGDLKFELPPDHDDEYHYRPRPTNTPPVSRHMFQHYFYGCYQNDTLSHRLHTYLPLPSKCRVRNPAAEILDFFPKRDRPVATASQSEKVELCYGIAARECRSFFRVLVYLCLILAPAFWFVFAWLFMWGDRGDLQDATVPLTLVLAMLSILWAVVHSGSDVRKAYGDS